MASFKVAAIMLLGMLVLASVSYAQEFEQPQFGESGADIAEPEAADGYGFDAVGPQDMMAQRRRLQTFLFRQRFYQPFPFFFGGYPWFNGYPGNFGGYPFGFNGGFPGAAASASASASPGASTATGTAFSGK